MSAEHPTNEDGLVHALVTAVSPQHTSAKISDCSFCDDCYARPNLLNPEPTSQGKQASHELPVPMDFHQRHLSRHMEQLSLFAVPPTGDDDEASEDDMNPDVDEANDEDDEDDSDGDDVVEQSSQEAEDSIDLARHMDALEADHESITSYTHRSVADFLHRRGATDQSSSDFRFQALGPPERRNSLADSWTDSAPLDPSEDIFPTDQDPRPFWRFGLDPPGQSNPEVAEPKITPPDPRAYTSPTQKDARDPLPDPIDSPSPTVQEAIRVSRLSGSWVCCDCRQAYMNRLAPSRCPNDGHYKCRSCHVYPDQDVDSFQHSGTIHRPPAERTSNPQVAERIIWPPAPGGYSPTEKDARGPLSRDD